MVISRQHGADASKRLRVLQPAERLARAHGHPLVVLEDGWAGGVLAPGVVESAEVVFLHMLDLNLGSAPMLEAAFARAKQHGVPVVVDTDDSYFRPADHGEFDAQLAPHLDTMKRLVKRADLITVTGAALADELADALADKPPRIAILPNWVDLEDFASDAQRASGFQSASEPGMRRVGFAGGSTHLHDLSMILPALAKVQREHPFELVLFGLYDRDLRASAQRVLTLSQAEVARAGLQAFSTLAQGLSKLRYRHVPSVPYAMFPGALATLALDVGLCPLRDSPFNRCRSAVKYYQYAATGAATLASDVVPYRGECPTLTDNEPSAWRAALSALLSDPARLRQTREAHLADVRARRTWDAVAPRYAATLLPGRARASITPSG